MRPGEQNEASPRPAVRTLWSYAPAGSRRGAALARELSWVLAWDDKNSLYLLNQQGILQARRLGIGQLAAAACADDGSAYVAAGKGGEITWLAPDLMPRWQRAVPDGARAVAIDALGQYAAVSDVQGRLYFFDRFGRAVGQSDCPRPLHHLTFVPEAPFLVGSSDYGLVACYDVTGRCAWRDGLVAHVGSLAASGDGQRIVLACFTDGLQCYSLAGKRQSRVPLASPCRRAALSYDGRLIVADVVTNQLLLLDADGHTLCSHLLGKPALGLALSATGDRAVIAVGGGSVASLDLHDFAG